MATYLKKFNTSTEYETYINGGGVILPNVSLTVDNNTVHYNPLQPTPPTPTHDFVEIGGIKWATMNVGANSVTDTGLYFQWGDTQGYTAEQVGWEEGQKSFDSYFSDYKWTEDGGETFTKYNSTDGLVTLQPSDDAVTAAWGGNWRMPTSGDMQSLIDNTTSAWTSSYEGSGIAGMICTDKTDSSKVLFFPAAGNCYDGGVHSVGSYGVYWSSSLNVIDYNCAVELAFNSSGVELEYGTPRFSGFPVRGVLGE